MSCWVCGGRSEIIFCGVELCRNPVCEKKAMDHARNQPPILIIDFDDPEKTIYRNSECDCDQKDTEE